MAITENYLNYIMKMIDMNVYIKIISFHRHADDSFLKGVLTEEKYAYGKSRAMVSLKICFLSWLYELSTVVITAVSPTVVSLGMHHPYYFDTIVMFLVIPFFQLMNDEGTKSVIVERGWYQGLRHMGGFQAQIAPQNAPGNQDN